VRNQAVLLNGVNNTKEALSDLIQTLADINIQPVSHCPSSYTTSLKPFDFKSNDH